jgi:hypothetical protein
MKIPVKISRFLIIPIFPIKTKQEIFTKSDEEPHIPGIGGIMATGLSNYQYHFIHEVQKRYKFIIIYINFLIQIISPTFMINSSKKIKFFLQS